jgi:hypothetical protein
MATHLLGIFLKGVAPYSFIARVVVAVTGLAQRAAVQERYVATT